MNVTNKLDAKRKEFKKFIRSIPELEDSEITANFDYNQYAKDVTIYKNGYGVIRLRCTIQTRSDKFRSNPHMFALGGNAKKDLTLPSFDVLRKGGASYRSKNKPFFSFRVIDANFAESEVKIRAIKSSKEQIDFVINFPKMPSNTVFQYEWAWGSPDLFPITQKDLAPGKRKEDRDAVLSELPNIVGGYKNFIYTLRFEQSADFIEKPVMNVYTKSTGEIIKDREFERQKSALYTNFVAKEVQIGILHGADIVARWVPK